MKAVAGWVHLEELDLGPAPQTIATLATVAKVLEVCPILESMTLQINASREFPNRLFRTTVSADLAYGARLYKILIKPRCTPAD